MKVGDIVGHPPVNKMFEPDRNWLAPSLKIGIEIELENPQRSQVPMGITDRYWKAAQDGSLRDAGFEYVLTEPLFGKDLTEALAQVEHVLKTYPLECNYRTGLHVHLDSRGMEIEELKRLFILYSLFERSIFAFVGDNRDKSNFCAPWFRISDHLDQVFAIFGGAAEHNAAPNILRNVERYSALNCNALQKYGSIEFRHLQMTRDFVKIRNWINLIMALYNGARTDSPYGPNMPVETLINLASKGGAYELARALFPQWFLQYVNDRAVWDGILLVRDVVSDVEPKHSFSRASPIAAICPMVESSTHFDSFMKYSKEIA